VPPDRPKNAQAGQEERDKQVRSYSDRAVALIRDAAARGYKDAGHMRQDEDLATLRDHADFQRLLTKLENSTAPEQEARPAAGVCPGIRAGQVEGLFSPGAAEAPNVRCWSVPQLFAETSCVPFSARSLRPA
jgi:hypothetical protein